MDRRFLTVLAASLAFALAISALFYRVVAGSRRSGRPAKVEIRDIVLAARALPVGIMLKPDDLKLAQVPTAQFPEGCFSKIDDVVDRPVASSILSGEPVREGRLAARGSGLGLAPVIPPGMRAVSVRVNEVVGVAGFVLPGMRVDVLVTARAGGQQTSVTKTVLQNILVISAGHNIEPDGRGQAVNVPVVTLLVSPEQAETLTLASEWRIQLVLRNSGDRTIEKTPGRRLAELFGEAKKPPAAALPAPRRAVLTPPPAPPRVMESVVVIRGTQRTVEQVGARAQ